MEQLVLSTRLKVPQPRKKYFIREALFYELERMKDCLLTIIKGGPGTGKTTLLSSYIKETALVVRWISLDSECNHMVMFWSYMVEALADIMESSQKEFINYIQTNIGINIYETVAALINTIKPDEEIILVLDDFHSLENEKLISSIEYFLNHIPNNLHIVILTREEPILYLSNFEMQGKLLVIDEVKLRLSVDEAVCFIKNTLTLTYPEETISELVQGADGWIGGLQLLAIASAGRNKKEISKLPMNNRMVRDYLTKEIYSRLNLDERLFLTHTSILSYFNQTVSEYLFPHLNYALIIDGLLDKNLMLQCIDEVQGIYQYHNILGEYLQIYFAQLDKNLQMQIHRKAAQIFQQLGDYEESLHHLFVLEDYQQAMNQILEMPQNAAHFAYLSQVPIKEAVVNFDLTVQKFFYHYNNYEFDLCIDLYQLAMSFIETDSRYEAFSGANVLLNQEAFEFNNKIMPIEKVKELSIHPITKALLLTKNAAHLFYQDLYQDALESVTESMGYLKRNSITYIEYFNLTLKTQICEEMGLFNKALALQEQISQLLDKNQIMKYLHKSTFFVTITGIYLKQMDLVQASKALLECENEIITRGGQLKYSFDYNKIEYLFLCGKTEEAAGMLNSLMALEPYDNIFMVSSLLKYLFRAGAMTPAMQDTYIKNYGNENKHTLNSTLLYIRILYEKGERQKALLIINEVLSFSRKGGTQLKIVEATLLKLSILINNSSDVRQLTDLYKEAVYYACEHNIRMPFYFESNTVAAIYQTYEVQICKTLSKQEKKFHEDIIKLCISKENCILSVRELEVIQALAAGLTNQEIADSFYISLATVKTHIINIYRKLNAKSRVAALDAARKMGLI